MDKAVRHPTSCHAAHRQQQRGIGDFALSLVLDYGTAEPVPGGGGLERRSMDKRALRHLERDVGARLYRDILREVPKLPIMYAIIAPNGLVITTGILH